jgi:hypothetical protein
LSSPDAPIASEGFFAAHFFTVTDQEKSKDFRISILGGTAIKVENPCYVKWAQPDGGRRQATQEGCETEAELFQNYFPPAIRGSESWR